MYHNDCRRKYGIKNIQKLKKDELIVVLENLNQPTQPDVGANIVRPVLSETSNNENVLESRTNTVHTGIKQY